MEGLNRGHMALKMVLLLLICILPFMAFGHSFADQRASLRRVDDETSMTFTERFLSAVKRSKKRVEYMKAVIRRASSFKSLDGQTGNAVETTVIAGEGEYLIEVGLGSPTVKFQGIADTGSDLLWTQCKPCKACFKQSTPIFDPSKSKTYFAASCDDPLCSELGNAGAGCDPQSTKNSAHCGYSYSYGDGSRTSGVLSYEKLTIGSRSKSGFKNVSFGCSHDSVGRGFQGGGLIGLGRGPLSLVSQLGSKINNKFSYCLVDMVSDDNATSTMFFGNSAKLKAGKRLILKKNSLIPTFWYVPMTGVSVGGKKLNIPSGAFDIQVDGSGGMIIDSGTTLTYFVPEVFRVVEAAIHAQIHLRRVKDQSNQLDVCYRVPPNPGNLSLPSVVFHFQGGVEMPLPAQNTYIILEGRILCLAMASTSDFGILGNVQQQNFHFLYDDARNRISFEPAKCASL